MATFVETKDVAVLIDPSVRLGPRRYDLPPHPIEEDRRRNLWKAIREHAKRANVLTVSHYHYDHHNPDAPSIYRGRLAYVKDGSFHINRSQKARAAVFQKAIARYAKDIVVADGASVQFGGTEVRFSPAVPHGFTDELGYVVMIAIQDGETTFVHTGDVEGPPLRSQLSWILKENPDVLYCDGPMTHMPENFPEEQVRASITNLERIVRSSDLRTLILDHHALRGRDWEKKTESVRRAGQEHGVGVVTAAGYLGRPLDALEYRRDELYGVSSKELG